MKYLLINQQTGHETLCEKVTIDGFDYYVTNINPIMGSKYFDDTNAIRKVTITDTTYWSIRQNYKSITACTNPNIDIPQVVDETLDYKFDREFFNPLIAPIVNEIEQKDYRLFLSIGRKLYDVLFENYKSQETHPFGEEDMIEFNKWICDSGYMWNWRFEVYTLTMIPSEREVKICGKSAKELLELWKSRQRKKVYYNE